MMCIQVVKDLILVLRIQYDAYSVNSPQHLVVLRKGLAVLHSLAVAADALTSGRSFLSRCADVNNEYLTLMFDIVHLFQQPIGIPEAERT